MTLLKKAWNNFKIQPEICFFYLFLAASMLSIRKVVADIFIGGEFNEYTGTYLYLSDIFLMLTIAAWGFSILYNKINSLSIVTSPTQSYFKNCSLWNIFQKRRGTIFILLTPLLFVAWSFISIKWSNDASIALYRSFKLFEFYLLFLFLALNSKCSTLSILRNAFRILIAIGLINGIIGIFQVILQHSLGLFWLKESLISPDLPGVAKIVLGGAKYIRAYGLFPHPNILGGFLLVSILLTFAYWRLFHACPVNLKCSTRNILNFYGVEQFGFLRGGTWLSFVLGTQIVAGILTFSKSAFLGLILALLYLIYRWKAKVFHACPVNSKCSPWNILNFYGVEHFRFLRRGTIKKAFLLGIIILLLVFIINPDFGSIFTQSLVERLVYINISLNMISGNFLDGIGSGQFVLEMQKYSSQLLLPWQFQSVHNVILLIWSELGLIGLSLFGWFIWKLFRPLNNVPCLPRKSQMFHGEHLSSLRGGTIRNNQELQTILKALAIGLFVIALFDHYLWDIQQGQIMLWLALGFLANTNIHNNLTK